MIKKTIAATLLAASYAMIVEDAIDPLELAQAAQSVHIGSNVDLTNVHEEYRPLRENGSGRLGGPQGMNAYVLSDNHEDETGCIHPGEGWIVVKDARVNNYHPTAPYGCFTYGRTNMMNGGQSLRDLMHRVEQKYRNPVDEMDSFSVNFHNKNTFKVNYSLCGGWEEVLERLTPKVGVDTYIFTRYI